MKGGVCAHTSSLVLYPRQSTYHGTTGQGRDPYKLDHQPRQEAGEGGTAHGDGIVERIHWKPHASSRGADGGIGSKEAARGQLVVLAHGAGDGRTRGRKPSGRCYQPPTHADDANRRRSSWLWLLTINDPFGVVSVARGKTA